MLAWVGALAALALVAPQFSPLAASSQAPSQVAKYLGEPVFLADFTDPEERFFAREESDATHELTRDLRLDRPGEMTIKIKKPNSGVTIWRDFSLYDFAVELDVSPAGDASGQWGLAFRSDRYDKKYRGSCYHLLLEPRRGEVAIFKGKRGNFSLLGEWRKLPPPEDAAGRRRIWLKAQGPKIEVYAAEELVLAVEDDTYDHGYLGIKVDANATPGWKVVFRSFNVYHVREPTPAVSD